MRLAAAARWKCLWSCGPSKVLIWFPPGLAITAHTEPRHIEEAQTPRQRPILDPPSPVIGSQASRVSTHATTACSGLLSAPLHHQGNPPVILAPRLGSCELDSTPEPESPPTTGSSIHNLPPSNDGTGLQLFAAAHRLPGHIGSHDFVSHICSGNGDVFSSALGPTYPSWVFSAVPPHIDESRGSRRPLPYDWTSTVWVPGLLISFRLINGGVSAGTLPRPPSLGLTPRREIGSVDWGAGRPGAVGTAWHRRTKLDGRSGTAAVYFLFPQHRLAASPSLGLPATYRHSTGSAVGLGVSKVALPAILGTEHGTVSGSQERRRLPSSRLHPRPTPGGWISLPLSARLPATVPGPRYHCCFAFLLLLLASCPRLPPRSPELLS